MLLKVFVVIFLLYGAWLLFWVLVGILIWTFRDSEY